MNNVIKIKVSRIEPVILVGQNSYIVDSTRQVLVPTDKSMSPISFDLVPESVWPQLYDAIYPSTRLAEQLPQMAAA